MLLWSEYNYLHALELSGSREDRFNDAESFHFILKSTLLFYAISRCIALVVFILQQQCNDGNGQSASR